MSRGLPDDESLMAGPAQIIRQYPREGATAANLHTALMTAIRSGQRGSVTRSRSRDPQTGAGRDCGLQRALGRMPGAIAAPRQVASAKTFRAAR